MAERFMSIKNSSDTFGDQPATFRLVAQCLNQLRHHVPPFDISTSVPVEEVRCVALNLFALANGNSSMQAGNFLKNSATFTFSRQTLLMKLLTVSRSSTFLSFCCPDIFRIMFTNSFHFERPFVSKKNHSVTSNVTHFLEHSPYLRS